MSDLNSENGEIECLNSKLLPACNVVVVMVRSIFKSWKQPLSYFFVHCNESVRFRRNNHTSNTEIKSH